jgi:hypothetical protein
MNALSERHGTSISASDHLPDCQVTAVEPLGLWLLVDDAEYFVPFGDYPQLREASLKQVLAAQMIAPGQLRWESLDIDVELEAWSAPERYPLVWR